METKETQSITDKIKAVVSKQLKARDTLSTGLANLRAKKVNLEEDITTNSIKRSEMVLERVELVKAGASDEGLDQLVTRSQEQETIDRAELTQIEITMPAEQSKLEQAETSLKRAVFAAIEAERPDAVTEALFDKAKDAVELWRDTYNNLVRELGVKLEGIYDGEWRLSCDVHLSNKLNKWFSDFVPDILRPEPVESATPERKPEPKPVEQPEPKTYTDAEIQADCRRHGRSHHVGEKRQAIAEDNYNVL